MQIERARGGLLAPGGYARYAPRRVYPGYLMQSSSRRRVDVVAQHVHSGRPSRPLRAYVAAEAHAFELGLEQQSDLSITSGSVARVAAALSRGADLRLYMGTNDDSAEQPGGSRGMAKSSAYEETLYFLQTSAPWAVDNSEANDPHSTPTFAGMCPHHTSLVHEGSKPQQPYFSLFRYDTSGTYSHIKWMADRVVDASQKYEYTAYKWFIRDHYIVCYEHDSDGNPLVGSIDALKSAVRNGSSIKVGLYGIASLSVNLRTQTVSAADNSVTFLPSLQPVIKSDGSVCMNVDGALIGPPPGGDSLEYAAAMEMCFCTSSHQQLSVYDWRS